MHSQTQGSSDAQTQQLIDQVERLAARVETLQLHLSERSRGRTYRWVAITGALIAVATVASVATSQEGDCDASLPFCFGSGTPARATEVNQNFKAVAQGLSGVEGNLADLEAALASKVDQDADGNVNVTGQLGFRLYQKDCQAELDATDIEVKDVTDCSCADGEWAISGGGWSEGPDALRESRRGTSASNVWRLGCSDPATGERTVCAGFKIICADVGNVD